MVFWTRLGAAIGLFFHALFNLHRSQTTRAVDDHGFVWVYECADCENARVIIEDPPRNETVQENEKEESQNQTEEKTHGLYKRRDETLH